MRGVVITVDEEGVPPPLLVSVRVVEGRAPNLGPVALLGNELIPIAVLDIQFLEGGIQTLSVLGTWGRSSQNHRRPCF